VGRLTSFIDDVLQSSRLAHQAVTTNVADVDLVAVIHHCVDSMSARHGLADGAVSVCSPASLVVATDRAALEIVLKNLIDNSIKYSEPPPIISVTAARDPRGRVVLSVEDKGVGIA